MDEDALSVGSLAPAFSLPDQAGKNRTLQEFRGHWIFLYFYPNDDALWCGKEAEGFRNHFPEFQALDIVVIGISPNSPDEHRRFAKKYRLPFLLLSDHNKKIARHYGAVRAEIQGGVMPISFLINIAGGIEKIYHVLRPEFHAKQVLADFQKITEEDRDEIEL